ncbi:macro domain-like protein, partial [Aspergillus ellipticus CBS 707.79]
PPTMPPLRIHLLSMDPTFATTLQTHLPSPPPPSFPHITLHPCALHALPSTLTFATILSPANSHGRLDGGFDDAISRFFSPSADYMALTHHVQSQLYANWRGYLPPGHCEIVRIPDAFVPGSKNVWGAKYVAVCPTMRVRRDARWDREIVYNCVWSFLAAVERHNRGVEEGMDGERIGSVLMTPLATGCGGVSAERWARQLVLALRHWGEAGEEEGKGWKGLDLLQAMGPAREVEGTWGV